MTDRPPRTLVVFASLGGNTRTVAQAIAETVGADSAEVHLAKPLPTGFMRYLVGGFTAFLKLKPAIQPVDVDLAAAHVAAKVHAHVAVDLDPAQGHALADALHVAEVAFQQDIVGSVAFHGKQIAHAAVPAADEERQGRHLGLAQAGQAVGR